MPAPSCRTAAGERFRGTASAGSKRLTIPPDFQASLTEGFILPRNTAVALTMGVAMRAIALMLGMMELLGLHAQAGEAPAIVIPSRPGVPVIINGGDASYCVVEGDVGLARPGLRVTVVACPPNHPIPSYEGSYFPAFGRRPGYGRLEVEPPPDRELPKPAES